MQSGSAVSFLFFHTFSAFAARYFPGEIRALENFRPKPRPEIGRVQREHEAVFDAGYGGDKLLVPSVVERPREFLDKRVREMSRQMRIDDEIDRADTIVQRHRALVGLGHRRDFPGFRDPAGIARIEKEDAGCPSFQYFTERPACPQGLAGGRRDPEAAGKFGERAEIVHPDRCCGLVNPR